MRNYKQKTGVTLIEILIVIVIIAILAALVIGTAARINTRAKERLTENTIAMLNAALEEFHDYGYNYEGSYASLNLKFPLDCNDFTQGQLEAEFEDALGLNPGDVSITGGTHDANNSGCEALYFFLSSVPESRKTLDKIDKSLITCEDENEADMTITVGVGGQPNPLFRIIDPWCITLRYSYYDNNNEGSTGEPAMNSPRTFPVITSAGPDGEFGTADDITGR